MSFERIHERIAHDLGVAILGGQYSPGATLVGEVEFSGKLNVSRSAFREAIRVLAAKGLVESRPKTGTRVTPHREWNLLDPDVLAWAMEAQPSEEFIVNLFELRMIVEPSAAALAASRRTGRELARMGHALEKMALHTLATAEGQAADEEFHNIMMESTRNVALMGLTGTIAAVVKWTTVFKQRDRQLARDAIPDHRKLYDAIAEASPQHARAAMVELISLALEDTKLSLDPLEGNASGQMRA